MQYPSVTSKALDGALPTLLHACTGISVSGTYMGCFREATCTASTRMQASLAVNVPDMTVKKCLELALMAGWTYGGLAPGTTLGTTSCYGGDKLSPTTVNPGCFAPCSGNSSERCGDNNCMVSVYSGEFFLLKLQRRERPDAKQLHVSAAVLISRNVPQSHPEAKRVPHQSPLLS